MPSAGKSCEAPFGASEMFPVIGAISAVLRRGGGQVGQGPVMARVMPGYWTFTNIVLPSGEKHTPASSEVE